MSFGSVPNAPEPQPLPPPPPPPPTEVDPAVRKARASTRAQAALAGGRQGSVLTTAQGLTDVVATGRKQLTGI